jgi:serine/threonine-protein kinase HipA
MPGAHDECALPLNGKTRRLTRKDIIEYFARGRLALRPAVIEDVLECFARAFGEWERLIAASFLSEPMKEKYFQVVMERRRRLGV